MSDRVGASCARYFGLIFILNVLFCYVYHVGAVVQSAVIDKSTGKLLLKEGFQADSVAWSNFTDDISNSGWAYLEVTTNDRYNDTIQAYAAGAVEGAVTSQLIYKHWMNTVVDYCGPFGYDPVYCQKLKDYIVTNLQWVVKQIDKEADSAYWHQVRLALLQLQGMEDAYNDQLSFPAKVPNLNPFGFL